MKTLQDCDPQLWHLSDMVYHTPLKEPGIILGGNTYTDSEF